MASVSYIHPSISSTITDNSTTYVTADGTTKLFAVFTSEKGVDNKIQMITSVSEYEFYYGEPNMRLYGQIGYNVVNWLNSGGVVYALRVLPDDAGYANAIVNIQTKTSTKQVEDIDGNLVEIPHVSLRPTITYTDINNTTTSSIEFDELRKPITKTIDGYQNNMLFAVIPKGRGKGYNDLGFRISLNDTYDSTYDFRLYNFEVTQETSTGGTTTIDGPYVVAMDPDALSNSGETLFIENVINKYSNYFQIIFNEDSYERLGEIINPNVNPNKLDFFNGITREVDGVTETYYDETVGKDLDVHVSLLKTTIENQLTSEKDITDPTDTIESAIVSTDNVYRNTIYNRYANRLERMKEALSKFRQSQTAYGQLLRTDNIDTAETAFESEYNALEASIVTLDDAIADDNATTELYNNVDSAITATNAALNTLLSELYKSFDYANISGETADSISATLELTSIESTIAINDKYSIKFSSMLQEIQSLKDEFAEVILNDVDVDKIDLLENIINTSTDIIDILKASNVTGDTTSHTRTVTVTKTDDQGQPIQATGSDGQPLFATDGVTPIYETEEVEQTHDHTAFTFADKFIEQVATIISDLNTKYSLVTSEFTITEDYQEALNSIFNDTYGDTIFEALDNAVSYTLIEYKADNILDVKKYSDEAIAKVKSYVDAVKSRISEMTVNSIITTLTTFQSTVSTQKQNTYTTVLQNFDTNISLLFGSDGCIDGLLPSSTEVEKLIVKGYKGTIDDEVTNKELYPIDVVLDANYSTTVKNALITLTTSIRDDFIAILDTKCQATPEQTINYRKNSLSVSNFRVAIFGQDFTVTDSDYTSQQIQVTPTYFLASKIPTNDAENGIQWNFVGPRRGTISGFDSISYIPNPEWKEQLYKAQVNYVEQDTSSTRFGSQLTSQSVVSALSNISCVRALLRIQRDVEDLMKDYIFEWNDGTTRAEAQQALNSYLSNWVSNRACDSIAGSVYASDYDRQQKIMRVKVELVFNSIIERIAIDLVVNS